jgi:hypothetical protein
VLPTEQVKEGEKLSDKEKTPVEFYRAIAIAEGCM